MKKLISRFDSVLSAVTAVVVVAMMLHVVTHALMRFLFNSPIHGTNEIVEFWYLPLVALLGIPAAQMQKEHITVSILIERMKDSVANEFRIFGWVLGILLSLGFMYFGLQKAIENFSIGSTAGVTDISTWPVYFVVPVCFLLLAALYLGDIVATVRHGEPDTTSVPEAGLEEDERPF